MEQRSLFDSEVAEAAVETGARFQHRIVSRYRLSLVKEAETPYLGRPCNSPAQAASLTAELAGELCQGEPREVMLAFYLDTRHRLIAYQQAFAGTLSRAAVEPRLILQMALATNAAAIIVTHNHPSGVPDPSLEDLTFTRRLAEAGDAVGVKLVDHVVVGEHGRWVSIRERGGL
jgi:DNA repair protein RadC